MLIKRKKLYLRIWKYRMTHRRTPLMRKMRVYCYKGFRITIWDNHIYDFRYEWKIEPLKPDLLRLCKMEKIIHDPTSMPNRSGRYSALFWAKDEIDSILANHRIGRWLL